VKTTTRPTARIHCPIEPEVLLADIQGELPIDTARLVQLHIRECAQCQARAAQLREAYERVASLAEVEHIPIADVREEVLRASQGRLRAIRLTRGLNLPGRGMLLGLGVLVAALLVVVIVIARPFLESHFLATQRSQNGLVHVPAVGPGLFYAETVKLIPVSYKNTQWDLGEIIAVDERTGRVVRSLPASSSSPFLPELGIGAGTNLRPALSADGHTIVEAAIAGDGRSPTAFAVMDALTGQVRYIKQLELPDGAEPQSDPIIHQMWISSDSASVFILTDLSVGGVRSPRLLQFSLATGEQSPNVVPPLDDTHAAQTLSSDAINVIQNSRVLYSAVQATDAHGHVGLAISFIDIPTRQVQATMFIQGDFRLFGLAVSPDGTQLFLFNGHTDSVSFISTASRSVTYTLVLGSPGTPPASGTAVQNGEAVSMALSPDGQRLFIALDAPADTPRNFELYAVSIDQQAFLSVTQLPQPIGPIALTSNGQSVILLRDNGKLEYIDSTNPQLPAAWVQLSDGTQIIQLIGADVPSSK
jgi:hypothetical protein